MKALLVTLISFALVVAGVAMIYVPAALIVAGAVGIRLGIYLDSKAQA